MGGRKPRPSVFRSLLAAAAALALSCSLAGAQDTAVAKVNGRVITEDDMKLAEAEIGGDLGTLPDGTRRRVLLEFLIENQLFADAAESLRLGAGAGQGGGSEYWRRRLLRDLYFDRHVRAAVNEADARRFYETQLGAAKPEEEVRARHILVESQEKARDLYEKIAHGSDFAALARHYSKDPGSKDQGGDLGFFTRGQMVPQFEEAAFKLKRGEVSQPFETQFGWHLVRVDERRRRPTPAFETVRAQMMAAMIHQRAQQVAADLRGKAQIEYIDPQIGRSMQGERPPAPRSGERVGAGRR
jgi:peptidyl-prolyl cis-trans isomerase C